MKNFKPGMPSPALIVAVLALFVALGSVSYAATQLKKNSVGTKQIKKNAVNSSKVKNKSLKAVDFKRGQLPAGKQGPQGIQGPKGDQGNVGQAGAPGISGYSTFTYAQASNISTFKIQTAPCFGDKKVIGGGVKIFGGEGQVIIDEAYPNTDHSFYGETRTVGGANIDYGMEVTVISADAVE